MVLTTPGLTNVNFALTSDYRNKLRGPVVHLGRIHTRILECDSRMRFKKVSRFSRSAASSPHSPHFCSHSPTLGRASILSQFNLVFSFNVKMDEAEVLAVWYLARKANKKCNRKLWVHPINQGRGEKGAYTLLYKELMDDCTKFFNYFRMTPSSFEELLEKVRSSIQMQDTHLRKSISPQERLCLTLR